MRKVHLVAVAFTMACMASASATAATATQKSSVEQPIPAQVQRLIACRALADSTARLACFDKEAGTMADAVASRDLVVIDKEGVQRTKRTLFGLSLPRLGIFDDDGNEVTQIDGVIEGIGHNSDGGYVFILKDGGRWTQIDTRPVAIEPERGDKVVVKRAALGSYMMNVNKQPGIRVRRVN